MGSWLPLCVNLRKVRLQPVQNLQAPLKRDAWRRLQHTYADVFLVRDRAAHKSLEGLLLFRRQVFGFVDHSLSNIIADSRLQAQPNFSSSNHYSTPPTT